MKEIRLGTIGSGFIVHSILDNVIKTDRITLEAVYSRSSETGTNLAAEYDCEKVYTDLAKFFADKSINTVYIASPNIFHFEQTKAALNARKHVITEKPFVPTYKEAKELADLAAEKNLLLFEAAPTTFLPNFALLKSLIPKLGRINHVEANYSQHSARFDCLLNGELTNIFDLKMAGGCLMDINFYNILLNVALFGKPVKAEYHPVFFPGAADVSGEAVLDYGSFLSVNRGAKDKDEENFFRIDGKKGSVIVENGSNGLEKIKLLTGDSEKSFNEQNDPDRWSYEVRALSKLLLAENHNAAKRHMKTTLETVKVIEEVRKTAGIVFPCDE